MVPAVFEQVIGCSNIFEGVGVGDEGRGVQFALGDEGENLSTAAAVHSAGLEGEVFSVHVREREHLGRVVQGHHGDNGVGTGTGPGQSEGVLAPGYLQYPVGASVGAVGADKVGGLLRLHSQHLGVVLLNKRAALGVLFADNDLFWLFQQHTLEGAQAGRTRSDDQHRIFVANLGNVSGPVAGGQDVPHKEGLLVGDPAGILFSP